MAAITDTKKLITELLVRHHQLQPARAEFAAMAPHRSRILKNAQRAVDRFWNLRDFNFRYTDQVVPVTPADGDQFNMPAPWTNPGRQGSIYNQTAQKPVIWVSLSEMRSLQNQFPNETGDVRYWTLGGFPNAVLTALVFPKIGSNQDLRLTYRKKRPTLEDIQGVTADGYNLGGLIAIPERWWESVIYDITVLLEMPAKGDMQAVGPQKAQVDEALFDACCEEAQGLDQGASMPRYPGGASVWELE